ncbi:MAG: DUF1194 domain-containing protein [Pseudomonadota bacterium]
MVRLTALAICLLSSGPVAACRLALVLAIDVSSSVDPAEDRLQRDGLAAALLTPAVQDAFFISPDPVALYVFEWSGRDAQVTLIPWMLIREPEDLSDAAQRVRQSARSTATAPTALGHALAHAALALQSGPTCLFQTIDVSGDGPNNDGFGPGLAYATFPFDGVTVNGLVILTEAAETLPYYRTQVQRGALSFVEVANGFADFATAMERKLIRELSAQIIGQALQGAAE